MTKILVLTKNVLQQVLRPDLQQLLDAYSEETGIEFRVGSMTFDSTSITIKLEGKIAGAVPASLQRAAEMYRLLLDEVKGRKLVDFKSQNNRYPFIFEQNGKRYKCSVDQAERHFAIG